MPGDGLRTRHGRVALASVALLLWLTPLDAQVQPASQVYEGVLTVVWGDPAPGATGGEARYSLALDDGRVVSLDMQGLEATAQRYFGARVSISGQAGRSQAVTGDAPTAGVVAVDAITAPQTFATPKAAAIGTKKVIYLLVKFPDDPAVPHPPSFYSNLNNPDTPPVGEVFPATLNGFFKKTSYDQFSWIGDVGGSGGLGAPGGWLTLPNPKSTYAPCGWGASCAQLRTLSADALALGRAAGIDFKNYDNINFVLSNDLDCCAWGGGYFDAVDNKAYGATWEPPWGQETSVYAHEMGHSLGLPHSGWVYYAYDSPWDVMSGQRSASNVQCGSYASKNDGTTRNLYCTEPGNGYIMPHKESLGWIPPANLATVNISSTATVTLQAGALPLTSAVKMVKVCLADYPCSGTGARFFTVEARVKALGTTSQFDNGIVGEGVIIHDVRMDRPPVSGPCYFNSQSGWALPVDSTPGDYDPSPTCGPGTRSFPAYALFNAQWTPGQTFVDSSNGVTVAVVSRSGSTFVVTVTNNPTPRTPTAANDSYTATLNTTLTVPAPGVLSNDTSNAGGAMTAAIVTGATSGTVTLAANGGFTYVPNTGFRGLDSFTYRVSNTVGAGTVATVTLAVSQLPPTSQNDSYSLTFSPALTVPAPGVLGNDSSNGGGAMTAVRRSNPANGTAVVNADGGFTYTPNIGFQGTDSFTYSASNAGGQGNVATVSIQVTNGPQPPTDFRVTSMVGNTVTFAWTPPALGPAPTSFQIEGGLAPGQVLGSVPLGVAPVATLTLPSGSLYLRMRTNAGGARSAAASNEVLAQVNVPMAPSAPERLLGLVVGNDLSLAWTHTFAGGVPTDMVLDVTGPVTGSAALGLTDTFSFAGVPAGTYTFSVRATNAAGSSVASNPVTLTFPTACSGAPLPVTRFTAYNVGSTMFLSWDTAASGPAPTGFVLNVTGAYVGAIPTPLKALRGTVPTGTYQLSVSATNACGVSAPTAVRTVTMP